MIMFFILLPRYTANNKYSCVRKSEYARIDCDALIQKIQIYNFKNANHVKDTYMVEIENENIFSLYEEMTTTINLLKDPWGRKYEHEYAKGIVFSKGPDGKHAFGKGHDTLENRDDIIYSYVGPLTLVDAKLEVNPYNGDYKDNAGKNSCFDILHLYFNKNIALPVNGNLDLGSMSETILTSTTTDLAASTSTFRYYDGASPNALPIISLKDLKAATDIPTSNFKPDISEFGDLRKYPNSCYSWGKDSKEIIIKYAAGYSSIDTSKKLLIAEFHYINICGARNNKNKTFYESDGMAEIKISQENGSESANFQILIKKY